MKFFTVILILFVLGACASRPQGPKRNKPSMDKKNMVKKTTSIIKKLMETCSRRKLSNNRADTEGPDRESEQKEREQEFISKIKDFFGGDNFCQKIGQKTADVLAHEFFIAKKMEELWKRECQKSVDSEGDAEASKEGSSEESKDSQPEPEQGDSERATVPLAVQKDKDSYKKKGGKRGAHDMKEWLKDQKDVCKQEVGDLIVAFGKSVQEKKKQNEEWKRQLVSSVEAALATYKKGKCSVPARRLLELETSEGEEENVSERPLPKINIEELAESKKELDVCTADDKQVMGVLLGALKQQMMKEKREEKAGERGEQDAEEYAGKRKGRKPSGRDKKGSTEADREARKEEIRKKKELMKELRKEQRNTEAETDDRKAAWREKMRGKKEQRNTEADKAAKEAQKEQKRKEETDDQKALMEQKRKELAEQFRKARESINKGQTANRGQKQNKREGRNKSSGSSRQRYGNSRWSRSKFSFNKSRRNGRNGRS